MPLNAAVSVPGIDNFVVGRENTDIISTENIVALVDANQVVDNLYRTIS